MRPPRCAPAASPMAARGCHQLLANAAIAASPEGCLRDRRQEYPPRYGAVLQHVIYTADARAAGASGFESSVPCSTTYPIWLAGSDHPSLNLSSARRSAVREGATEEDGRTHPDTTHARTTKCSRLISAPGGLNTCNVMASGLQVLFGKLAKLIGNGPG
jgi:hypothetical protein